MGRLKWYQAAGIIGVSDRQMRRWKLRYERWGYDGLLDRRCRRPSRLRIPVETVRQVLTLYREQYPDFNVLHFHEKLEAVRNVHLSYTWVKVALQTAGLVAQERRRGRLSSARPRRPLPGMLLQPSASTHAWIPFHNRTWTVPPEQKGSAFVPYMGGQSERIFAVQHDRTVGNDNRVAFGNRHLQILPSRPAKLSGSAG